MHKHFAINYGPLHQTFNIQLKNPKFLVPISYLHSTIKTLVPNSKLGFISDEIEDLQSSKSLEQRTKFPVSNVEISHPWPEWVELMKRLLKNGYFKGIGSSFKNREIGPKDSNQIRTACLNFARDRSDLIRCLSRKDIQVIAGSGCPTSDRKVVNSGKRLRAHVGIDEGNVCSSCILRGNCERAYVKASEDEGGRTVDVIRFLYTYGLDPITGTVDNKPCLNKRVKESVRRLLKEMVEFSMNELESDTPKSNPFRWSSSNLENSIPQGHIDVPTKQGDWICPKCDFLNFARNIKCLRCDGLFQERLKKLGEDQDHLPLKKGDWICDRCNFLNFAKNTRCFRCEEKPPKRELNPGEWECDSCNYLNFRKNMVCLKCDHRRQKASNSAETSTEQRQSGNRVVNRWRFVEDEGSKEQDDSNSMNEISRFEDFPITGGKSDLSQDVQKRERWKMEMAERSRKAAKVRGNAHEFKSAVIRRSEFVESTDDEEMAEWFGHGKLFTVPEDEQD